MVRLVAASRINRPVLANQMINLIVGHLGKEITEQFQQVISDIALEEGMIDVRAGSFGENGLEGSADIIRGVHQSAVNVKQINRKGRNHAGCGLPPSRPGTRTPPSGR